MSYERSELAEQGGFIRFRCRGCGRPFWSDGPAYCGQCEGRVLGWDDEDPIVDYGDHLDAQDAGLRPKEEGYGTDKGTTGAD